MDGFVLSGIEYPYFHHPANNTSVNERIVEIPIFLKYLEDSPEATLEVGNVLGQYTPRRWATVDLVEKEEGVTNCDILDWNGGPYDLIVSISTFEHIGRDFGTVPTTAIDAILHCCDLLAPKGRLVFTVPLGYHPILDQWLFEQWKGTKTFLKRVSEDNCWRQVEIDDVRDAKYGEPFKWANAIVISEFVKEDVMKAPQRYGAVCDVIRATRAKALLEVGTWNGERAIAMADAAWQASGKASYVGFDLFEKMTADKSKAEFNAKTPTPESQVRGKLDAFKGKHKGFSYNLWKGDTRETLPKYLAQAGQGRIDLVWLDGGHSVETVASDWENCRKAVRAGGVILLDDYYSGVTPSFLKQFGCNMLIERLIREKQDVSILPIKDPVVGGGLVQIVRVNL